AAAMQPELGIAADEARGVDAQRQIAADAVTGVAVDRRLRLAVDPAAFHRRASLTRAQHAAGARCRRGDRELRKARGQLLPSARLLHQPERRGRSLSSLSAELDSTGSIDGAGAGGVKDARGGLASSRKAWGAGSRTVERRRGGSAAGGSGTGPAICADGASCGRVSAGGCTSPRGSAFGAAGGSLSAIGAP